MYYTLELAMAHEQRIDALHEASLERALRERRGRGHWQAFQWLGALLAGLVAGLLSAAHQA